MRRGDLLELDLLGVTDEIRKLAYADQGVYKKSEQQWRGDYTQYQNRSYLRTGIINGILKIEIYHGEELRDNNEEPAYILFLSKEENKYTTFLPRERKWSSAKLDNLSMGTYDFTKHYTNTFWISEKDQELAIHYLDSERYTIARAVGDWQTNAMHRKEIQTIDRVMNQVTQMPADFGQWVRTEVFWRKQYLFYNAKKREVYCTACKKLIKTRIKSVHNQRILCPECGRTVTGKSWNKQGNICDWERAALIQKIQDGYIIRKFYCRKEHRKKDDWKETITLSEGARQLWSKSMKPVKEYAYTRFKQSREIRWCNCNYLNNGEREVVYPKNLESLRRDIPKLQDIKIEKILDRYKGCPVFIERLLRPEEITKHLINTGLIRLAMDCMESWNYIGVKKNGKDETEVLGINKDRIDRLKKLNGGKRILSWLQYEQKTGKKLRQELLIRLDESQINPEDLKGIVEYGITPERALNYLEKQKNHAKATVEWKDYLKMAKKERLNLEDDIVRFPKNLKARHDEMVELANNRKEQERLKGYRHLDRKIKNYLPKVEKYYWEDKEYMIIPAAKCEELMREGRALHHCVGASDMYMKRMAAEESWILFLRKKENLEKPYYTIEIEIETNRIRQWYSEYDRQPDRKKIKLILDKFLKSVKRKQNQIRISVDAIA